MRSWYKRVATIYAVVLVCIRLPAHFRSCQADHLKHILERVLVVDNSHRSQGMYFSILSLLILCDIL